MVLAMPLFKSTGLRVLPPLSELEVLHIARAILIYRHIRI